MNCRESIRGNPPLCCYSIGLTVFASSLLIGGWFMVTYPDKVQDIDFIWQNRTANLTHVPRIPIEQARLASDRIDVVACALLSIVLLLMVYMCIGRKEYKQLTDDDESG